MLDTLKNFWQANLEEIRANKIRFAAIIALLVFTVIFALIDSSSAGEEISLNEPAPQAPPAEKISAVEPNANVIPIQNNLPASENITAVAGANSAELYVRDPFKQPPPKIIPAPVETPAPEPVELPQIIFTPPAASPVAQEPTPPAEEFVLRGTAISGNQKSAIIHKISDDDKQKNFIVNLGDNLGGRRVVEITADTIFLDDGTKIFLAP